MHIAGGFPDPLIDHTPRLHQVLKEIKVQTAKLGKPMCTRLTNLHPMEVKVYLVEWQSTLWWFNTVGSFSNHILYIMQIREDHSGKREALWSQSPPLLFWHCSSSASPNVISLNIKQSKTDQLRKGVKVVIGRTNDDLCPVSALLSYLSHRGNFPGPLFCWQNKIPLSKSKFVSHVRLGLLRANLPADKYAGHSFWIGAATTAASAGIEDSTIQTLGRWQSSSYLLYIRLDPRHMASLSSTLVKCSIWTHSWICGITMTFIIVRYLYIAYLCYHLLRLRCF